MIYHPPFSFINIGHSPTLYSQITGKYASVESKIFPHILLLCSISYSCFNGLTINQHFIKPLQGEKCTSYLSVVDLSIVLTRVFFFAALCRPPIYGPTGIADASPMHSRWKLTSIRRCLRGITEPSANILLVFMLKIARHRKASRV